MPSVLYSSPRQSIVVYSHQMLVSLYREGEAALDLFAWHGTIRLLERAARKHSLLTGIERDLAKLLPVHHNAALTEDVMNS